jgi:hypothetical protein
MESFFTFTFYISQTPRGVHCFEDCPNVITIPSIKNALCIRHKHRITSATFSSEGLVRNELLHISIALTNLFQK